MYPENFARIVIAKGASIGANATILPNITVGRNAMIGAGAVVTRSVPPNAIVELTHNKMITFALSLSKPVMNLSNGVSVVRQAHHERFCNHFISG